MATKVNIIKNAFDQLYADLKYDLSAFLKSSLIAPTNKQWKTKGHPPVGNKWTCAAAEYRLLLLEVTPADLVVVKTTDIVKRFFRDKMNNPIEYKASSHPGVSFLLCSEWGDDTRFNTATCDLINSFTPAGKAPYISPADQTVFVMPKRKSSTGAKKTAAAPVAVPVVTKPALNLILYGPPGTGKTYNTIFKTLDVMGIPPKDAKGALTPKTTWFENEDADRALALIEFNVLKSADRIAFTTFHQSMSYEDFVEGIKPTLAVTPVGYIIEEGIFKQISDRASADPENNYVLIIDEINRGNIANIFGELITLIEEDKRKGCAEELSVVLPYSKKPFSVPKNLYIIGTMNTADRSVEALDSALRRRFSFEEMMPKPSLLGGVLINRVGKTIEELLVAINERIEILKDREHQIGHSYFMKFAGMPSVDPEELETVFTDKIIPLLQEYFYGDYEKIQLVVGDDFVKEESGTVKFAGNNIYDDAPEKRFFIESKPDMEKALKTLMNI